MYELKINDDTRRLIGDALLDTFGPPLPICGLSDATGISRVTLRKWIDDDHRLYWLTKHIDDDTLFRRTMHTPDSRDSRYHFRAVAYCRRVVEIRRRAASGELGADLKREEDVRIDKQNAKR